MTPSQNIQDLGDGLILRRATPADTEALVAFNATIHSDHGPDTPDEGIGAWVRDLMTRPHPTFDPGDFTIVEDARKQKIVSSLNLIAQTWSYAGIEFGVGRPELVGTDPDYRKRGFVSAQFDVVHQWSEERGHKVQAITGIPYYYRQFGYEMGLALGGGRVGYLPHIPKLKDDEEDPYLVRRVEEGDIPFLIEMDGLAARRELIHCQRDETLWRYEISGKSKENINRAELRLIENAQGEAVGFFAHPQHLWGPTLVLTSYELKPGISWLAVTPSILRYIQTEGEAYAAQKEDKEFQAFAMWLGSEHPVYTAIEDRLPRTRDPYAWYVRVADLPDFLRHVAPVLETRLEKSILAGHSGELKTCFFRSGIQLTFEKGKLKGVENYIPTHSDDGDVLFPDLTFLRVLFGYNSFWEIEKAFADCYARNDHGRALLPILFPKQASNVWGVS